MSARAAHASFPSHGGICTLDLVPCLLVRDFSTIYEHETASRTELCGRCRLVFCKRGNACVYYI